ncbi:MAG: pilus assembly FimT family protein [Planctomycetota bacterium]|jgi:Tfp pilus assembly protein FimT
MSFQPTSSEPRRLSGGGGFSLIELVAVMVGVGIISATADGSLSSTTGNRATMAAKQLQRDMTFARQRAVATGTPSWVEFDSVGQTWTVRVEDPSSPGRAGATVLTDPATNASFVQALDANQFISVQLTSVDFDAEDWIGFDWLGRPLKKTLETTPLAGEGSVVLTGGHKVTVEKDTGHIAYVSPP